MHHTDEKLAARDLGTRPSRCALQMHAAFEEGRQCSAPDSGEVWARVWASTVTPSPPPPQAGPARLFNAPTKGISIGFLASQTPETENDSVQRKENKKKSYTGKALKIPEA